MNLREQIADTIYCNLPMNYDGTNPEKVKEVMEMLADKILSLIRECVSEKKEIDPDKIDSKDKVYIIANNLRWNACCDEMLKKLGG